MEGATAYTFVVSSLWMFVATGMIAVHEGKRHRKRFLSWKETGAGMSNMGKERLLMSRDDGDDWALAKDFYGITTECVTVFMLSFVVLVGLSLSWAVWSFYRNHHWL